VDRILRAGIPWGVDPVTDRPATTLLDCFSRAHVINVPDRTDRLRACVGELGRFGMKVEPGRLEIFPAIRPAHAAGFRNAGVHGCFLSHLAVLRGALRDGLESVLVLEDDVEFTRGLPGELVRVQRQLREAPWGFAYLGHVLPPASAVGESLLVRHQDGVATTHCYAVHRRALPRVVTFLESVLRREPGDPDGGPMDVDGAYSFFRARNPDVLTLVAATSLATQRPSRSDITPKWFDDVPGLSTWAEAARWCKRVVLGSRRR
jgi:hypothetical protein